MSKSSSFRTYIASWKSSWLMNIFLPRHFPFNYVRLVLTRIPKGWMFLRRNRVKIFLICYFIKISKPLLPWKTGNVRFFNYIVSIIRVKYINDIVVIIIISIVGAITTTGRLSSSSNDLQSKVIIQLVIKIF